MPRAARNKEEIAEVKNKILDHALNIICNEGYDSLTMRKLGGSLGCSAKNIYYYYSCKEDLYLWILTRGFETLNAEADKAIDGIFNPLKRLRILCKVYINFGLKNVHYYNIMFSWDLPKYTSYIGTFFESAAWKEKEVAMHYTVITEAPISQVMSKKRKVSKKEIVYHLVRMWSQLHGFVTLHNSSSFREYHSDTLRFRERLIEELLNGFKEALYEHS